MRKRRGRSCGLILGAGCLVVGALGVGVLFAVKNALEDLCFATTTERVPSPKGDLEVVVSHSGCSKNSNEAVQLSLVRKGKEPKDATPFYARPGIGFRELLVEWTGNRSLTVRGPVGKETAKATLVNVDGARKDTAVTVTYVIGKTVGK